MVCCRVILCQPEIGTIWHYIFFFSTSRSSLYQKVILVYFCIVCHPALLPLCLSPQTPYSRIFQNQWGELCLFQSFNESKHIFSSPSLFRLRQRHLLWSAVLCFTTWIFLSLFFFCVSDTKRQMSHCSYFSLGDLYNYALSGSLEDKVSLRRSYQKLFKRILKKCQAQGLAFKVCVIMKIKMSYKFDTSPKNIIVNHGCQMWMNTKFLSTGI